MRTALVRMWLACLAAVLAAASPARAAEPLLNGLFSDHAVVQRDRPINVWGRAKAGETITLALATVQTTAQAGADGKWSASLPALAAGGPYTLVAKSDSGATQRVNDVLIGDVWLCSGQSNMVLQVRRTNDSRSEIENARNDRLRMLTVGEGDSAAPLDAFPAPVKWLPTTPADVREFSATCYYFARELQKTVDVPMGLVVAAWGGSSISSWMSHDGVDAVGGKDVELETVKLYATDRPAAARRWGEVWQAWWKAKVETTPGAEPWGPAIAVDDWRTAPTLGAWDNWGDPALVNFTGMGWYRTSVNLTAKQAAQTATLNLGGVDEIDETWVNGTSVGGGSGGDRTYELPPGTLKAGENSIVVNVLNTYMLGGLLGPAQKQAIRFKDGSSAPLVGPWLFKAAPKAIGRPPRAPWEGVAGVGMAYNAMIAPIGRYGFRGAVWYQGETDSSDPSNYNAYLKGLMADWRGRFGVDLPFLVVQTHGYGRPSTSPQESGWAELREAQREAVAGDAHAGLAVTIDISDRYDVHPANKQELGRRLARAARHVVYGEGIVPTGPTAVSAQRMKKDVVIDFADVEDGLVAYGAESPIGFELCGPAPGSCKYASARIDGDRVTIAANGKPAPTRVRYCWADSPICTLFDKAGLPAGPFELPIETAVK